MQALRRGESRPFFSWCMVALVFGLVLVCYWPALHGAILWDDPAHVPRPDLRSWAGLARIWTDLRSTQQYYPVLFSAFWVEHRLWGDATTGYHLVNVVCHATSCCVLALLLLRLWAAPTAVLAGDRPARRAVPAGAAWFAAVLFAVHPVGVESVAWITEQKNTLSLLFYLLAALAYWKFTERRRPFDYALASALFLLALGSKTVTVTLPAALLVVAWWKHGRLAWRRDVRPLVPWFLAAAAIGLLTSWVERTVIGAEGAAFTLAPGERVLLAGRIVWFYVGKLAWPTGLMFFYPRWDAAAAGAAWLGWLAAAAAVTAGLWALRRRSRGPLAAWLLFVGGLFPVLGFFNVFFFVFSYVNDHFQYLASLGLFAATAAGTALALAAAPAWARWAGRLAGGAVVLLLAALAHRQSGLYRDNETLFRAAIAANPESWMGHHILGFALAKSPGHRAEAIAQYREALRLNPAYPDAHLGLAVELAQLPGRTAGAIAEYEKALALRPYYAEAHAGLAAELVRQPDRLPEAIAHAAAALRVRPALAGAQATLGDAFAQLPGRLPDAIAHYEAALRLDPDSAAVHYNLANTLAGLGRMTEARTHYEAALRLKPDFAEAHANLANVLATLPGGLAAAIAQDEAALRLNPKMADAHYNLAMHLAQMPGRATEAIAQGEESLRLRPGNPEAHNTLAILYAGQGQWAKAREHWETALRLAPNYEPARKNLRLLDRMKKR